MKYYIATSLDNHLAHNNLRDWLSIHRQEITYDWTTHGPMWKHGLEAIQQVSVDECDGVRNADFVVVLWPGGRGTHVELGIALGCQIPVFFMSKLEEHHTACKETCAFYHHGLVRLSKSEEELTDQLKEFIYE